MTPTRSTPPRRWSMCCKHRHFYAVKPISFVPWQAQASRARARQEGRAQVRTGAGTRGGGKLHRRHFHGNPSRSGKGAVGRPERVAAATYEGAAADIKTIGYVGQAGGIRRKPGMK